MQKRWPGLAEALGLASSVFEIAEVDRDRGDEESLLIREDNRLVAHSAAENALRPMIFRMLTWPRL